AILSRQLLTPSDLKWRDRIVGNKHRLVRNGLLVLSGYPSVPVVRVLTHTRSGGLFAHVDNLINKGYLFCRENGQIGDSEIYWTLASHFWVKGNFLHGQLTVLFHFFTNWKQRSGSGAIRKSHILDTRNRLIEICVSPKIRKKQNLVQFGCSELWISHRLLT